MAKGKIEIGTCQFAVSGSIEHNAESIMQQMREAASGGVDVVHFCECALSGYAGIDFESFDEYDWDLLHAKTEEIMRLAKDLHVWVILGSSHKLTVPHGPHNSLYLIGPDGEIHDRYDKRFCMANELPHYTPGDHFVLFEVNGVKCALLICFDLRFPELYRKLKGMDVQCVFQSFYNARQKGPSVHSDIMVPSMQCRAATNYFWVSMSNSSGWFSPYSGCFIRPDGRVISRLEDHKDGVIINTVDTSEEYYDPSSGFRQMAMMGSLDNSSGALNDDRSVDRTCY